MKTIEVTVTKAGEVTIADEDLKPGMVLQVTELKPMPWPPKADAEHPLWGEPFVYIDPTRPLDPEDWGSLA